MTRSVVIVGLLATLFLTLGGPGFSITPAGAAEMMQADKAMMKATGEGLMALKTELAAIQAELQMLMARLGSMGQTWQKTVDNYCATGPGGLTKSVSPNLCQ